MPNPFAPLRRLIGRRAETRSAGLGSGYVPAAPVLSGTYITPQTAIGLAPVYAAINVISRDIAGLERRVYRKLPGGGRVVDEAHPLNGILRVAPNDHVDAFRFLQASMGHVLGWGNGLSRVVRDPHDGRPLSLHLLHPSKVAPKVGASGGVYYEDQETKKTYPAEDVLHFAGLGFNGIQGYSPVTVCRQTVGLAMGAEQVGASMFGNGLIAKGILKIAKRLSPQAQANLRNSINQVHQGSQSANQFLILEEGMDWVNNQINPNDGQWLETRQFQVTDIARIFSLPPHKIGDYSESHLANVEEANRDYIETTLKGWIKMLKAQLNWKLLTAADRMLFEIDFDLSELQMGNTQARVAYYAGMRNAGAMSADDIRVREGLNPLGPDRGGDKYVMQGQYTPLERLGEAPAPAPPIMDPAA